MSETNGMNDYALLDSGNGRRLERFAGCTVSRPAPGALWRQGLPKNIWTAADLSFSRETGWQGEAPANWHVHIGGVTMTLRPAGGGQVGLFPEHAAAAKKILARAEAPGRVLNLFAHTGLATLMLAAAGNSEITHVDGAAVSVKQARENAALSGLSEKSIRWLVDDTLTFLRREARREKRYDIILADPPSFGRGGKKAGEWRLERDLPELLALSRELLNESALLVLTCHTEGWADGRLSEMIREHASLKHVEEENLTLTPEAASGKPLPGGTMLFAVRP